jgi:HK97 family phage portal protein
MSLLSWIGQRIKLTDGNFWAQYFSSDSWTGEPVSPVTAMQISAFSSGVGLRARTVGTCPMMLYEKAGDAGRILRDDHPLYRIVHDEPNADQSGSEYWMGVEACVAVYGNAYSEKVYRGTGENRELIALNPLPLDCGTMQVTLNRDGSRKYTYLDEVGKKHEFTEDKIFHVKGFGFGGRVGWSPFDYGRNAIGSARAADHAAAAHFANGMRGSGWLISKQPLSPEMRELARTQLAERMTGPGNAGKVGILEGDFFDYKPIGVTPEVSQLLETRRFSIEEICRLLGNIPPILVAHSAPGQTMYGAGVGEVIRGWYKLWLRSELVLVQQQARRQLIPAAERQKLYFEFSPEAILQGDPQERAEFYWKLIQVGGLSPNQICDYENYPRFEGGDRHYVNQTLAPLDENGAPVKVADAPATDTMNEPEARPQQRRLEVVQ